MEGILEEIPEGISARIRPELLDYQKKKLLEQVWKKSLNKSREKFQSILGESHPSSSSFENSIRNFFAVSFKLGFCGALTCRKFAFSARF